MTRAQVIAWNIYAARLQAIIDDQHERFASGDNGSTLTIAPPTKRHVEIAQEGLDLATREAQIAVIRVALSPLIDALDALDNSHSKSEAVKECRMAIQAGYDELHALKQRIESPPSVDAVSGALTVSTD